MLRARFHTRTNQTLALSHNLGAPAAHSTETSFGEVVDLEDALHGYLINRDCGHRDTATGQTQALESD